MVLAHPSCPQSRLAARPSLRLRVWVGGAIAAGMACASLPAAAQDPSAPGGPVGAKGSLSDQSNQVKVARSLFSKGMVFLTTGDHERALDAFLRSRAAVPRAASTRNAAICLTHLERYDEALEMYEILIEDFGSTLGPTEKEEITSFMAELRKKVGSVNLTFYVQGRIFIDRRARGRLPLSKPLWVLGGKRVVRILSPDHHPLEVTVEVPLGGTVPVNVPLVPLQQPPESRGFMEAFGGYAGGGTLGGDAVSECLESCAADGYVLGARAGYRFSFGGGSLHHSVALEITGGYLLLKSRFSRVIGGSFLQGSTTVDVFYNLEDEPSVRGPFVGTGLSYRLKLGSPLEAAARITAGVLSARSADPITGTATTNENDVGVRVVVSSQNEVVGSQPFFLMPELGMNAWWDDFYAGISLGIFIVPSKGPSFSHVETGVKSPACGALSGALSGAACAPNSDVVAGERAYGPLWVWVPQIAAGHVF